MHICSICSTAIWKARDVCKGKVAQSETEISELYAECTQVELKTNGICKDCYEKLLKYHEAKLVMERIRTDFLTLLQQPDASIEDDCEFVLEQLIEEDDGVEMLDQEITEEYVEEEKNVEIFDEDCAEAEIHSTDEKNIECVYEEPNQDSNGNDKETTEIYINMAANEIVQYDAEQIPISSEEHEYVTQTDPNNDLTNVCKCEECGESFRNKRSFEAHMKRRHFTGFICEHCGKTLYTRSGLVSHLQNHNEMMEFVCNDCGQRFKNKFSLKHHQAWHTGLKPFQCDVCSKQFVHYLGLYRHKKIHDDSNRCIKCEKCGFKFRTNAHLRRHMISHTGAKPHSCPICGKFFSQSYNLKVHIQEHQDPGSTRQRRFKCKRCSRSFRSKENYQDHCKQDDCMSPTN